ncbi:hypothetical protein POV27_08545 [Aureisphaera galaxeae]|uniref:hypothetical protein n=1 Tax=Aureisphaera galaxeae TaxID=1538023 RepID=UPI0023509499|nr:hypothetical protein [Aureisphaera galaxeae]MDC8004100.1 hypothetical protein [Aureisphaera galaxeae]
MVRIFKRYEKIVAFDYDACKLTVYLGVIFFIISLGLILVYQWDRAVGPYWFGVFLQPILWLIVTQLLRFEVIRKYFIFRFLIFISFIITFERFVIIVTSLHRDYLPSSLGDLSWKSPSWNVGLGVFEIIGGILFKIALFTVVVLLYRFVMRQLGFRAIEK